MRVQVKDGAENEAVLVKFDAEVGMNALLEAVEAKLGYRPAALYVGGARCTAVDDLEENDVVTAARGDAADSRKRRAAEPAGRSADGDATAATAATAAASSAMQISIMDQADGNKTDFKVKPGTKMRKVMQAYMDSRGISEPSHFRFTHDGERMTLESVGDKTISELDIEDGDQLDAWVETVGGGRG